jgi:hypothetical protein
MSTTDLEALAGTLDSLPDLPVMFDDVAELVAETPVEELLRWTDDLRTLGQDAAGLADCFEAAVVARERDDDQEDQATSAE